MMNGKYIVVYLRHLWNQYIHVASITEEDEIDGIYDGFIDEYYDKAESMYIVAGYGEPVYMPRHPSPSIGYIYDYSHIDTTVMDGILSLYTSDTVELFQSYIQDNIEEPPMYRIQLGINLNIYRPSMGKAVKLLKYIWSSIGEPRITRVSLSSVETFVDEDWELSRYIYRGMLLKSIYAYLRKHYGDMYITIHHPPYRKTVKYIFMKPNKFTVEVRRGSMEKSIYTPIVETVEK